MDKLDMFQERFGKVYKFGWWDMDRIQTDDGNVFYPKGVSGRSFCMWVTTCISVTRPLGNECPS